jgi:flagellar export protein FliJ
MVKSRDHLIRLKRFQVDERRRRVAQIESMIADFARMVVDLDREIASEEQKSGISDPAHYAYPTFARAAVARRDNLKRSSDELKDQLEEAKSLFGDAQDELKKVESLDGRDKLPGLDAARSDRDMGMARLARA